VPAAPALRRYAVVLLGNDVILSAVQTLKKTAGWIEDPVEKQADEKEACETSAKIKPYFGPPKASLMAPIANGPKAAAPQVKNRMTPDTAPCSVFRKQLMPLELIVG